MPVETASYISQLVSTYPAGTDAKAQGDDHIKLIKSVLQSQFPNLGAAGSAGATGSSGATGADGYSINGIANITFIGAAPTLVGATA